VAQAFPYPDVPGSGSASAGRSGSRRTRRTTRGGYAIGGELRELAMIIAVLLDILGGRAKLYAVMQTLFDEVGADLLPTRPSSVGR
jgi:DNA gyrase subunit A